MFELQIRRTAVVLIDDVSFVGCAKLDITLPTVGPQKAKCNPHTQRRCKKDNKCIPLTQVCDYINDCSDGQDEQNCGRFLIDHDTMVFKKSLK